MNWTAERIEQVPIARIKPYKRNSRTHSQEQVKHLAGLIQEFGFTTPVLMQRDGTLVAGHGRLEAAKLIGLEAVPAIFVDHLSPRQIQALVIADNKVATLAGWDFAALSAELSELAEQDFDLSALGFNEQELAGLLQDDAGILPEGFGEPEKITVSGYERAAAGAPKEEEPDAVDGPPVTVRGDVWILGGHRVMCGDSSVPEQVVKLLEGQRVDCVLTDPPYCSGGFQESGKSAGSVGTRQGADIHNDKLSTRGYMALMKSVLSCVDAGMVYAFTDWRMWIHLYDVAESCGFGVRSLIVWDKGSMGMGIGWRAQHELILFSTRKSVKFDPKESSGNVLTVPRSGNKHHPTEKPVPLIEMIIGVTGDCAELYYDPFIGSGTTLIACEKHGKRCRGMELSQGHTDTIVRRWQALTGREAVHAETGKTFEQMRHERA